MNANWGSVSKVRGRLVLLSCLVLPGQGFGAEVMGGALEFYGVMHGSLDYRDSDVPSIVADQDTDDKFVSNDFKVSSNSSRLGVKGVLGLTEDVSVIYQWEHGLDFSGTKSDAFSLRNSFVGVRSGWGDLLFGRHDTPFKMVGSKYSLMNDTVADRGAILGASALSGSLINTRADKVVMWRNKVPVGPGNFDWVLQYSQDCTRPSKHRDNDGCNITAVGLQWQGEVYSVGIAHDHWTGFFGSDIDATRLAARANLGEVTVGLIADIVHQESEAGVNPLDREAYGANVAYRLGVWNLMAQGFLVTDYEDSEESGAIMMSAGIECKLTPLLKGYLIYTQTDNESNARFQGVDGSHGEEVATVMGGTPKALSLGFKYAF
ncbi:porin [Aestuariicella sp. G3-2]|uniref:porin n=1 Tax=Pseudomaricurvus albidus TaxID=2842452 RepID=UPI001C0C097D|nr:porin [Aestuariicella albida]MBU3069934.1 porin [Aestuariicella albida]